MPPKKRLGKELPTEGSSQAAGEQVPTTAQTTIQTTHIPQTFHPQPSIEFHAATIEARRPRGTTNSPGGGARHEHLNSNHYTSTPKSTPNHRNPKGLATRL
jgi:hypothetical protein